MLPVVAGGLHEMKDIAAKRAQWTPSGGVDVQMWTAPGEDLLCGCMQQRASSTGFATISATRQQSVDERPCGAACPTPPWFPGGKAQEVT